MVSWIEGVEWFLGRGTVSWMEGVGPRVLFSPPTYILTHKRTVEDRLELVVHVEVQVSGLVADRVRALVEDHGDERDGDVALVVPAGFFLNKNCWVQ